MRSPNLLLIRPTSPPLHFRLHLILSFSRVSRCRFGAAKQPLDARAQERNARTAAVNVMQEFGKSLPLYVWLVALPQLTSRVCHPHAETQRITQHILTRVTAAFPHQVSLVLKRPLPRLEPATRGQTSGVSHHRQRTYQGENARWNLQLWDTALLVGAGSACFPLSRCTSFAA